MIFFRTEPCEKLPPSFCRASRPDFNMSLFRSHVTIVNDQLASKVRKSDVHGNNDNSFVHGLKSIKPSLMLANVPSWLVSSIG